MTEETVEFKLMGSGVTERELKIMVEEAIRGYFHQRGHLYQLEFKPKTEKKKCSVCNGSGKQEYQFMINGEWKDLQCSKCKGTGKESW